MARCCAVGARSFTRASPRCSKSRSRRPREWSPSPESDAALLAHHWLRAEDWEKALNYTLEAAERAQKLFARPEAINHYWQALELLERLPGNIRTEPRPC